MRPKLVDDMVLTDSQYVRLSDEQLTLLAYDIQSGYVFGSWDVRERDKDLLHHIFAILSYVHDIEIKRMKRDGIDHFYEYQRNRMSRTVEGYPCFMTCQMLDQRDYQRLQRKLWEIEREDRHAAL